MDVSLPIQLFVIYFSITSKKVTKYSVIKDNVTSLKKAKRQKDKKYKKLWQDVIHQETSVAEVKHRPIRIG